MNHTVLVANLAAMGLNLVYAVIALAIGLAAMKAIDRFVFPEIDFMTEIKRGNIAAAIFAGTVVLFMAFVLASAVR